MKKFAVVVLSAIVLAPLSVRAQGAADATLKVAGAGIAVSGWTGRVDPNKSGKIEDVKFVAMGSGMHITGGPHAILWNPANTATGDYTVKATITKTAASKSAHEESYGVFIAGSKLNDADQNYLYCVVFGSGSFSVIHRYGSETHPLASKKVDAAVTKGAEGTPAKDEIALWVKGDKVGCSINGKEVFSDAKSNMLGAGKMPSTDGIYGLRASHNLDLHVAGFGMTKN